ncbi:LuxR family two component transcriptional regulator [Murinocardiopsis flavida]|uniref:LuxR family two component transcriptional regulator n=1 Tax=Murinocardiopsis flavida TaxID=645275 RepID=A0A2P8CAW1_9ACTN|nr:response regulator transcription factor [Murinocardiopsis flavida]PSK82113.1 LuxR family two component transcriptional regulator [Murinocardiopsis flavida]
MSAIRVVVADDHPVVRDGLTGVFRAEDGIEVVGEAAGGHETAAVVARIDPDVIVLDLRMPGGGVEAIRTLRALDPARPRILVFTTYDTDRDIRGAMEAGADGYLLKDVRSADLVRAVHDVVGGRLVLVPAARAALTGRAAENSLTAREVGVLRLVADGRTNRAIAARLGIGEATVKTHRLHVYEKLAVTDRASAVRTAWERGLV